MKKSYHDTGGECEICNTPGNLGFWLLDFTLSDGDCLVNKDVYKIVKKMEDLLKAQKKQILKSLPKLVTKKGKLPYGLICENYDCHRAGHNELLLEVREILEKV